MSAKKLLTLLIVVAVLAAFAAIKKTAGQRQEKAREAGQIVEFELIKDLPESFISRIVVYKGSDEADKLVISRNAEGIWILDEKKGIKASKEAMDKLLSQLKNLKGEIRAQTRDVFADFQIEDQAGLHIILEREGGKVLKHLVVSFLQPEWGKNFARLFDSQNIVLVPQNIPAALGLYNKDSKLDPDFFSKVR